MSLSEFELIHKYFSRIDYCDDADAIGLGVGDDCALLTVPGDQQLAISIDTLVEGVHFPDADMAFDIAKRSVAVTLSDLAAMGAEPKAFTLALTMPGSNRVWLQGFSRGLREAADEYGIALIGGDTTKGPLTISIQVHGFVPEGAAIQRSNASLGDRIVVSGYLGDARAALDLFDETLKLQHPKERYIKERFYRPQARIALGQQLRGLASSAIDVSDGLLADLGHLAKASSLTAQFDPSLLPLSPVLSNHWGAETARGYALTGGDDYELCFTVPEAREHELVQLSEQLGIPLTVIGKMVERFEHDCIDSQGQPFDGEQTGFQHFS